MAGGDTCLGPKRRGWRRHAARMRGVSRGVALDTAPPKPFTYCSVWWETSALNEREHSGLSLGHTAKAVPAAVRFTKESTFEKEICLLKRHRDKCVFPSVIPSLRKPMTSRTGLNHTDREPGKQSGFSVRVAHCRARDRTSIPTQLPAKAHSPGSPTDGAFERYFLHVGVQPVRVR